MNRLQTILNDEIGRRTEIARSGTKINWDERSDLLSQFMGTKMTETRSDAYGYNARSELTNAVKNATLNEYAYRYDDIGNRETSFERGMSATYAANCLNQYTDIEYSAVQPSTSNLQPLYDADGNQTLIKTKTGIWAVTYNGENRPVRWERIEQSEQSTNRTILEMKFDRMGRRVEYIESVASSNSSFIIQHSKFVYDGYLCIQRLNGSNNSITELFEWDPTEKVATRPMFMQYRVPGQTYALFYTHDGNKNVSEVVHYSRANGVAAHYEYAPFGEVTAQVRQGGITAYDFSTVNPWRFSSEYSDDASATVYYNYRHYEPVMGCWNCRDRYDDYLDFYGMNPHIATISRFCDNNPVLYFDVLGDFGVSPMGVLPNSSVCCEDKTATRMPFSEVSGNGSTRPCCSEGLVETEMSNCTCMGCAIGIDRDTPISQGSCLPDSANDGSGDALRHCIWSCMMSRRCGKWCAFFAANAHELDSDGLWSSYMDIENNDAGRAVANSSAECDLGCLDKYFKGELVFIFYDPSKKIKPWKDIQDCVIRSRKR